MRLLRMKVVLTDGPALRDSRSGCRGCYSCSSRGYEIQALGAKTASLECGVHRNSRALRSRLDGGLEYISAAVLLVPLEGDLNASVGIVRDEIEDGAVLPIVVSKCAIAAVDCSNTKRAP